MHYDFLIEYFTFTLVKRRLLSWLKGVVYITSLEFECRAIVIEISSHIAK
jgi:hypothetical protein